MISKVDCCNVTDSFFYYFRVKSLGAGEIDFIDWNSRSSSVWSFFGLIPNLTKRRQLMKN